MVRIKEWTASLSFRDRGGDLIALPLREAQRVEWSDALPVRTPAFHPDQQRNPGWFFSHKAGRLLPFESRLEYVHLLIADLRRDVNGLLTQPFRLHWKEGERSVSHVPDALLLLSDGSREVLNVTVEERRLRPDVALRLRGAQRACRSLGWRSRLAVGAPSSVLTHNIRLLAGCRREPIGADVVLPAARRAVDGALTIAELERQADEPMLMRPALLHLLAVGELECDLEKPLTLATVLRRAQ